MSYSSSCRHHLHHPQLQQNWLTQVHLEKRSLRWRERNKSGSVTVPTAVHGELPASDEVYYWSGGITVLI